MQITRTVRTETLPNGRRVFYVDVGNKSYVETKKILERLTAEFKARAK